EFLFPWGWDELEGIANRTDYDLKQHTEHSGEDLRYFDQETNERFFPYVIEPAAGATRTTFAFLIDAYTEEEVNEETRVVLRLDPRLAPYKAAVLPLSKKPELIEPAEKIATELRRKWMIEVDTTQSIGRRYRRQDEIGTPYCVTVDFDTLEDHAVTVRDRDSMAQERVSTDRLLEYLSGLLDRCDPAHPVTDPPDQRPLADGDRERVREATDIVDLISEVTKVRRSGRTFMAICPFHEEKTPSMSVDRARGLYHCFGCGEGGDVFTFIEKTQGVSFPEALEILSNRAGITLTRDPSASRRSGRRAEAVEALRQAIGIYNERLKKAADAGPARAYLRSRGYDVDVIDEWKIGFAGTDWDTLTKALKAAGVGDRAL